MPSPSVSARKPRRGSLGAVPQVPLGRTQARGHEPQSQGSQNSGWIAENFVCHGGLLAVDDLMRQLLPATQLVCVCVCV